MNHTGLKSLNNLPEKLKIQRVSIDWRLNNWHVAGTHWQQDFRRWAGQAVGLQGPLADA
jgi:hypothetical protein